MDDPLYRAVVEIAADAPGWVRAPAEMGTDGVLVVFAVLMLAAWWRARRMGGERMAVALLAPVGMIASYAVSEIVKEVVREDRPCRALRGVATILPCPEVGDWSWPSNHATLMAAAAAGLVMAWRALAPFVVPLALLGGGTRVFLGVHYPLDVVAGLTLGAVMASVLLLALRRPVTGLVLRLRGLPGWRPLLACEDTRAPVRRRRI